MYRAEYSEEVAMKIDNQVRTLAKQSHEIAKKLIRDNREVIDRLVELLIEKETINGEELRKIVAEYTYIPEKEQFIS